MIDLREADVGIAVVNDVVLIVQHLPNGQPHPIEGQILGLLPDEVERLVGVMNLIELFDAAARLGGMVPELARLLLRIDRIEGLRMVSARSRVPRLEDDGVTIS
jgi:hypothetical protein